MTLSSLNTTGSNWKIWIFLGCFGGMAAIFLHPASAMPSLIVDADAQYGFAVKLFQQEAYSAAIFEFQRFTHFFPDDPRAPEAMAYTGKAYCHSGQYDLSIKTFQDLINRYEGHKESYRAFFYLAGCYLELGQPKQAVIALNNLIALTDDSEIIDEAYYRMGWIKVNVGLFHDAVETFNRITPPYKQEKGMDPLLADLTGEKNISLKNPTLAGVLSVLPGAGQLYCGRYKDALSAFIINTGLILAAVESFENDLTALGATISFFEFGFYSGNIYGAIASAHKHNERETKGFVRSLQDKYRIGLLSSPQNSGIMLSFQYLY